MPIAEMKAGGDILIDTGEVPIAKKFRDVRKLIAETRKVDADFAQLAHNAAAPAQSAGSQIAISPLERFIENPIIGFQFGELQVGQLHDEKDLLKIAPFIDDQRGIPINYHQVMLVVTERADRGFI